jgi:hypothetical protein
MASVSVICRVILNSEHFSHTQSMASHGQAETERLKAMIEEQLQRLLTQLEDLEELRAELDDDEYDEVRADTMEQLEELRVQTDRLTKGDMSLVSSFGAMRLAMEVSGLCSDRRGGSTAPSAQAAIKSEARTPEIIRMFAAKQAPALRGKLAQLQEDRKLGRVKEGVFRGQVVEVCNALKKLGEELTEEEAALLRALDSSMEQFTAASDKTVGDSIVGVASASATAAAAAAVGSA